MEDQFHGAGGSASAASEDDASTPAWNPMEQSNPWPLARQIHQLLGEDCELDPAFFEESWTSGLPAAVESRQVRRDRPAVQTFQSCTFAELNGLGAFCFSQAGEWSQACSPYARFAMPTASYAASWLREPLEEPNAHTDHALPGGSAVPKEYVDDQALFCSMQYQRACELLSVSKYSTELQIKAAYRRMAGQWHPDRLERGSEEVREFATKQMAAINEAYRYLRGHPPMASC